jgi:positive regulator of sigma E activity
MLKSALVYLLYSCMACVWVWLEQRVGKLKFISVINTFLITFVAFLRKFRKGGRQNADRSCGTLMKMQVSCS